MLCAVPCLAALTRGLSAVQVAGSVVQQQASWRAASTLPEDYDSLVIRGVQDSVASVSDSVPDKEAGMCAGVPLETYQRKVRIFSPARTAGQQGLGNTAFNSKARPWRIAFDGRDKWINPLMGWTSTADPLENVARSSLHFHTKEEAMAFCRKHGWTAVVDTPNPRQATRQRRFGSYGDNFSTKRAGVPDLSTLPSNRSSGSGKTAAKQ